MKKLMTIMIVALLIISLCGCSINFGSKEESTEPESIEESVYVPTLEEVLGYSGEDLMSSQSQYNYQKVQIYTNVKMTGDYRGRTTPVEYSSSYTAISDAYYRNDILTENIVIDNNEDTHVTLRYTDLHEQIMYTNKGYEGWVKSPITINDTRAHIVDDWYSVTDFYEDGNFVIVEGTIVPNGSATVTNILRDFITEYGGKSDSLTSVSFIAKFNKLDRSLVNIEYMAELGELLSYGGYQLSIDSISCAYVMVEENNDNILSIPEYVKGIVQDDDSDEEEYVTLVEYLLGMDPSTVGDISVNNFGINYSTEDETLDYDKVEETIRLILTTLSVEDFTESYPDSYQTGEEMLAANSIMLLIASADDIREAMESQQP